MASRFQLSKNLASAQPHYITKKENDPKRKRPSRRLISPPAPPLQTNQPPEPENSPHRRGGEFYQLTADGKKEWKERMILAETYDIGDVVIIDYPFGKSGSIPSGTRATIIGWQDDTWIAGDPHLTYFQGEDKDKGPGIFRNCLIIRVIYDNMRVK